MRMFGATIALGLAVTTNASLAQTGTFFNGNKLYEHCQAQNVSAISYVQGLIDAQTVLTAWDDLDPRICTPPNVNAGQVIDVVCADLQQRPERRHLAAASLALNALQVAFPCSN